MFVPNIPGDSQVLHYEDWIQLYSVTQKFDSAAKGTSPCVINVTKGLDKAGPRLWGAAVTGQALGDVQIDILKASAAPYKFYEILLGNARVLATTATLDGFAESLTLSGDAITIKFIPQLPDGRAGTPVVANATCK